MVICYGLICYKNFEQVKNLVNILNVNGNIVIIHVDEKSNSVFEKLKTEFKDENNIHFVENRIEIKWGGIQQIECECFLFHEALKYKFDYFKLISESCLPVKSDKEIKDFLTKNVNKEYIECFQDNHQRWRVHLYHKEVLPYFRKHFNLLELFSDLEDKLFGHWIGNKDFSARKVYLGTSWILVTRDFLKYLDNYIKKYNINELYRYTICADEMFVQAIFKNSPFYKNIYDASRGGSLNYTHWALVRSPRILTEKDLKKINNPTCMYARKFDLSFNPEFVKKIYKMSDK